MGAGMVSALATGEVVAEALSSSTCVLSQAGNRLPIFRRLVRMRASTSGWVCRTRGTAAPASGVVPVTVGSNLNSGAPRLSAMIGASWPSTAWCQRRCGPCPVHESAAAALVPCCRQQSRAALASSSVVNTVPGDFLAFGSAPTTLGESWQFPSPCASSFDGERMPSLAPRVWFHVDLDGEPQGTLGSSVRSAQEEGAVVEVQASPFPVLAEVVGQKQSRSRAFGVSPVLRPLPAGHGCAGRTRSVQDPGMRFSTPRLDSALRRLG